MIIDHPTQHYGLSDLYEDPAKVVKCDFCGRLAERSGVDAGEAAEKARKCGFTTTKIGKTPGSPLKWTCGCKG